jgi:Ras-related protein Rab-2A
LLVGNKCDEKDRQVSLNEGLELAHQEDLLYLETSAALNINIDTVFEILSSRVYSLYKQMERQVPKTSVLSKVKKSTKPKKQQMAKCCGS